jgi:hypothetical protein
MDDYLEGLAQYLYEHRKKAIVVPFRDCSSGAFQPVEQDCHRNVELWCRATPGHTIIRGWLVFEVFAPLGFCRFNPHSVVRDEQGELFDLTPTRASQRYPFLYNHLTDEEYVLLVSGRQLHFLDHKL